MLFYAKCSDTHFSSEANVSHQLENQTPGVKLVVNICHAGAIYIVLWQNIRDVLNTLDS